VLGTTAHLLLANTSGAGSVAGFVAATETANMPTGFGGALLVEPGVAVGAFLPAAGLSLPLAIPASPQFLGVALHVQALQLDPGARFGIAFSRGLHLIPGY
jgi:hypothetical protein